MKKKFALILGGAGFIGSHISKRFLKEGYKVVVIDGLLKNTGGKKENLQGVLQDLEFIEKSIDQVKDLKKYLTKADIIIDSMAWTSHLSALKNPQYDLELNVLSHLKLLQALKSCPGKNIIYLGSRGQYGNPKVETIIEDTKMEPLDVQGINKLAGESYFRIFAKPLELNVASLRLGNCFGPNQPIHNEDIGLVGSFIKNALTGQEIVLYGENRKRNLIYAADVAEVVFQLSEDFPGGFNSYNLVGSEILLKDLVQQILVISGSGSYHIEDIPDNIKRIDMGSAQVSESKLEKKLGKLPVTDLSLGLRETINYFKRNL